MSWLWVCTIVFVVSCSFCRNGENVLVSVQPMRCTEQRDFVNFRCDSTNYFADLIYTENTLAFSDFPKSIRLPELSESDQNDHFHFGDTERRPCILYPVHPIVQKMLCLQGFGDDNLGTRGMVGMDRFRVCRQYRIGITMASMPQNPLTRLPAALGIWLSCSNRYRSAYFFSVMLTVRCANGL